MDVLIAYSLKGLKKHMPLGFRLDGNNCNLYPKLQTLHAILNDHRQRRPNLGGTRLVFTSP